MKKRRTWPLSRDSWNEWREYQRAVKAGARVRSQNYRRHYARGRQPWKVAEDRRLLRLHARHSQKLEGLTLWVTIAHALKRTVGAARTRHAALLAGARL